MTKKTFTLLFIGIISLAACAPKALYRAGWQNTPVVIDGNASEWRIPLRFYDPDTKLNYTLSNDDEKLFLCIRIVDELSQAKIMRNGLNIWFDTLAKRNKQCGILYPVPDKAGEEGAPAAGGSRGNGSHHRGGGGRGGNASDDAREKFLQQANQMQLVGFKKSIPDYLANENEYGINISINWDANNIMIYEVAIPFGAFYKPKLEAKDSLKNFDFSMTIHGFTAPKKDDDGGGNSGGGMGGGGMGGAGGGMGGGMGGGGMGGGGMGGGGGRGGMGGGGGTRGMRGGGSMAEADPRYETNSFWARIKFSVK